MPRRPSSKNWRQFDGVRAGILKEGLCFNAWGDARVKYTQFVPLDRLPEVAHAVAVYLLHGNYSEIRPGDDVGFRFDSEGLMVISYGAYPGGNRYLGVIKRKSLPELLRFIGRSLVRRRT